jgi:hypothetical protein
MLVLYNNKVNNKIQQKYYVFSTKVNNKTYVEAMLMRGACAGAKKLYVNKDVGTTQQCKA